jgi:hypothetical protein
MDVRPLRGAMLIWCLAGLSLGCGCGGGDQEAKKIDENSKTGADAAIKAAKFSFFVTSLKALQELSGSTNGFGGDLRFGETGAGAGLRGADKLCTAIAERSMPGSSSKRWRAFLSATADENGQQVDAVDRIGNGPWYDRLGRVFALTKADLLNTRPQGADPAVKNDFPNEDGVPNHQPDPTLPQVDNHDFLTGSDAQGRLYGKTATCQDWTTADGSAANGRPRVGHSWPRSGTSMNFAGVDAGFVMPFGPSGADSGTCGCVDETGTCHLGVSNAHCGTGGEACAECATGQMCNNGVCDVSDGGTTGATTGFPFGMMGDGGMIGFPFGMMGDGGMAGFPFGIGANPFAKGDGGAMSMESMEHWISALDESGCGAGLNLSEASIPGVGDSVVGGGGGYGGFYCFALTP